MCICVIDGSALCFCEFSLTNVLPWHLVDGRVAGHLGPAVGLKTLSIHVCVCPHFGM